MEITSYNHHLRRLLSSQRLWSSNQDYWVESAFALIQSGLSRFLRKPGNGSTLFPPAARTHLSSRFRHYGRNFVPTTRFPSSPGRPFRHILRPLACLPIRRGGVYIQELN